MLTRLHIRGFKNLIDTEVRFGPFTCIAGPNGSGKSNLFDAIMFLGDLADYPIIEAASRVRNRSGEQRGDLGSLFSRTTTGQLRDIEIEADFVIPKSVKDDFDREAKPSATFLNYKIALRYVRTDEHSERLMLLREELTYIPKNEARKRIGFPCSKPFFESIVSGNRRADYIKTEERDGKSIIKLRQDGVQGRASEVPAHTSPRTLLGSVNTDDRPTVLAARREMQSWSLLQLEPSKLRMPDDFSAEPRIESDGSHLAATLHRLGRYTEIANRLSDLLPEVRDLSVDLDEARRLKTLVLEQRDGVRHSAQALSDGTLRFLALAIIAADPETTGVICLEEPENGIHPSRIPAIVKLLKDTAVSSLYAVDDDNPLRQVIINTHSPTLVQALSVEDLLVAFPIRLERSNATAFGAIRNTWRSRPGGDNKVQEPIVSLGMLLDYLERPLADDVDTLDTRSKHSSETTVRRFVATEQASFDFMKPNE